VEAGACTAVAANEVAVPTSVLREAQQRIRDARLMPIISARIKPYPLGEAPRL
jgi:hypothetical protein